MALPTLSKTWQHSINQAVTAQGSAIATEKRIFRTIKNLLIGFASNAWTVRGSGNATTGALDAVDRWTTDADLTKNTAGNAHSWIVLRQTGIATNFEICIDLASATANTATLVVSPAAAFTGGTNTARPTATDEIVIISASNVFSNVDATHQIHAQQSTDGACTRISIFRGTTNECAFWLFDKPLNPPAGWTNPSVSIALNSLTAIATVNSTLVGTAFARGRGTATINIALTGEAQNTSQLSQLADIGTVADDTDSAWPFFPVGLISVTASNRGWKGTLADLWWSPVSVADADTFPNDAANRQFVRFGGLLFPWTGSTDVPALV